MHSQRYFEIIKQNTTDAQTLGITGTPAFFILDQKSSNVQKIIGAQPYETFERVFNSMIEK